MPKDTIYLQQAYKSLEKVLSELTDDNFQNTERNQSADLFKRIADKIKEETKLSALTQLAKSSPISHVDINLLLINPLYKDNVADLVSQLNLDRQHFEEFEALELIIQHLKEFIKLSRLADVAADASQFQKIRHFNLLKTLGSMAKLQFTVLLTDVQRFLSHCQHENNKIKTISVGLIDYLNESAVAKIDFSTATFLKNYYQTDSKTLQASFKEDKTSFNNEFNTYLNSFKPEAKKNQSDDVTSSIQEENQPDDDDIFYDAIDDEIFYDALVEQETKLLAYKPTENQNNFKKLIIYILIVSFYALNPFLNSVKISLFLNFAIKVIEFLEKTKKNPNVKKTPLSTDLNDIHQTPQNPANNHSSFFNLSKPNQSQTQENGLPANQSIISS